MGLSRFVRPVKDAFEGLAKAVERELDDVILGCLEIVLGFVDLGSAIIGHAWALLWLTGSGLLLVYLRREFISSADGFAVILPPILEGFNMVIKTVDGLIGVVGSMGVALSNLIQQKSVADANYGTLFKTIPTINTDDVAAWIREVPSQCAPYTSATSVLDGIIRDAASPAVCPAMRRLYVVDWLYPWVYPIVDFFSLTYDPTPPYVGTENNCYPTGTPARWECLVIGVGYVILEVRGGRRRRSRGPRALPNPLTRAPPRSAASAAPFNTCDGVLGDWAAGC